MKAKTTPLGLISFCFLVFSIYTKSLLSEETYPPVLDTDGNELQIGVEYYITSAFWGAGGGGLIVDATGNETCPLSVIQLIYDTQYGLPLSFHPANSQEHVIRLSTDINIRLEAPIFCAESTVLKVDDFDESAGKPFIRLGGELGNPGCRTARSWFKIEEVRPRTYKLVFRPTVCDVGQVVNDVGIFKQEGKRRLALTNDVPPFLAVFRKVLYDQS